MKNNGPIRTGVCAFSDAVAYPVIPGTNANTPTTKTTIKVKNSVLVRALKRLFFFNL